MNPSGTKRKLLIPLRWAEEIPRGGGYALDVTARQALFEKRNEGGRKKDRFSWPISTVSIRVGVCCRMKIYFLTGRLSKGAVHKSPRRRTVTEYRGHPAGGPRAVFIVIENFCDTVLFY